MQARLSLQIGAISRYIARSFTKVPAQPLPAVGVSRDSRAPARRPGCTRARNDVIWSAQACAATTALTVLYASTAASRHATADDRPVTGQPVRDAGWPATSQWRAGFLLRSLGRESSRCLDKGHGSTERGPNDRDRIATDRTDPDPSGERFQALPLASAALDHLLHTLTLRAPDTHPSYPPALLKSL